MNIVIIGYRGTGKSEVGAIVAQNLNMTCIGMDAAIVDRAGMTIPEIVEKFGWDRFRDMETDVARDFSSRDQLVIDTGGGVIERPENIPMLKTNALVIWLKASADVIVSRVSGDTQRPSLTDGKTFTEEVADVLDARMAKYESAAQFEIDTDHLTPTQVADRIVDIWQKNR